MADRPPVFNILEDGASGAADGYSLSKVAEGDAAAAKRPLAALIAKDTAGNLQYPKVNLSRELVISKESAEIAHLSDVGEDAAGSATYVDVATIPLALSTLYKKIFALGSCYRNAEFRVIHDDNGTPAVLIQGILVGDANHSHSDLFDGVEFTSGGVGTQQLILQAKNLNALSALKGTLAVEEINP